MAKIYPLYSALEEKNKLELVQNSEKKAKKALSSLSDDYRVFCNLSWSGDKAIHGHQDFECDFLLAHPNKGFLIIEVKGGSISYEGKYDLWESHGKKGSFKIKNPIDQAIKNKYSLKQFLSRKFQEQYHRSLVLKMAHCVWFIDTDYGETGGTLPRAHKEIILDRSSIFNIKSEIEEVYHFFEEENKNKQVNPEDFQKILSLLLPSGQITPSLAKGIEFQEKEILNLTQKQLNILHYIKETKRVFLSGGAGTGKTILGIEKAKQEAYKGNKVLFTCYNKNLAFSLQKYFLSDPILKSHITVINFHRLCHEYAKKIEKGFHFEKKENINSEDFWNYKSIEYLEEAIEEKGDELKFSTLIIDEIQDFSTIWINSLIYFILKNPKDNTIYFLGDKHQSVFNKNNSSFNFEEILQTEHFTSIFLNENFRNGSFIFSVFENILTTNQLSLAQYEGEISKIESEYTHLEKTLTKEINKLLGQKILPQDIAVLSETSLVKMIPSISTNPLFTFDILDKDKIFISNIRSFKGLEKNIILFITYNNQEKSPEKILSYIACSRAKHMLILIGGKKELDIFDTSFLNNIKREKKA